MRDVICDLNGRHCAEQKLETGGRTGKRCFVTNNILYEGRPVGYLYREEPDYEDDSGWRITTGTETDEYMNDSGNSSSLLS